MEMVQFLEETWDHHRKLFIVLSTHSSFAIYLTK